VPELACCIELSFVEKVWRFIREKIRHVAVGVLNHPPRWICAYHEQSC
jgi:hypothetical protein